MKKILCVAAAILLLLFTAGCSNNYIRDYSPTKNFNDTECALYTLTKKDRATNTAGQGGTYKTSIQKTNENQPVTAYGIENDYIAGYIIENTYRYDDNSMPEGEEGYNPELVTVITSRVLVAENSGQVFQPLKAYRYVNSYIYEGTDITPVNLEYEITSAYTGNDYRSTVNDISGNSGLSDTYLGEIPTPYADNEQLFYAVRACSDLCEEYITYFYSPNAADAKTHYLRLNIDEGIRQLTVKEKTFDCYYANLGISASDYKTGPAMELYIINGEFDTAVKGKFILARIIQHSTEYYVKDNELKAREVSMQYDLADFRNYIF